MYGGFPVKLTTHIGNAIYPDFLTVDQIREQTLRNMTDLIKKNQILPGNILRAIGERFSSENEDSLEIIPDEDTIDPKEEPIEAQCSKIRKKCKKKHYLHFQKWQKINFCTRKKFKTTKNAIFGLKKQDFW